MPKCKTREVVITQGEYDHLVELTTGGDSSYELAEAGQARSLAKGSNLEDRIPIASSAP
jgi:hypothetical protein